MNYYKRFPGDFLIVTMNLTMVEDGAYNRLMDWQYKNEKPLPKSRDELYRVARANKPEERRAVDRVVADYFGEDGWQDRTRAEIADAKPRIEAAKQNGAKSRGRPKKNVPRGPNPVGIEEIPEIKNPVGIEKNKIPKYPDGSLPTLQKKDIPTTSGDESPPDPLSETIWKTGVSLLVKTGSSESSARSFLGKHAKTNRSKLAEVIAFLAVNPAVEPKAYIEKGMQPQQRSFVT